MIDSVFRRVLSMSAAASAVILVVIFVRLLLRKAPKSYSLVLWLVVLFRLLSPAAISIPIAHPQPVPILITGETVAQEILSISAAHSLIPAMIWLSGCTAMLLHSAFSWMRLRRQLAASVRLRDNLYLADHIASPFVIGLVKPRIYLPSTLSQSQFQYVIPHEQHHIRRLDHITKPLFYAALCIHWFNPLAWAAFAMFAQDMEMSCDEAVLQSFGPAHRCAYSASLVSLATGYNMIGSVPLAFGNGNTKGRIKNMLIWKKPKRWIHFVAATICILTLTACASAPLSGSTADGTASTQCTVENCTNPGHPLACICTDINCTDTAHPHHTADRTCANIEDCTDPAHHHGNHPQNSHHSDHH